MTPGSKPNLIAGKYRVVQRLASGGMGDVELAAQEGPAGYQRLVALKRIRPALHGDTEALDLFLDEARLVARLSHRNICSIIELGEESGGYYVAMEFVKGASVHALLAKLRAQGLTLDPAYAVEIAAQVADALSYAYTAPGADGEPLRIIHRDVTPHNVLLSISGDVKLIDFGVAKSSQQEHASSAGMVKGKLAYLSPEQSRGHTLDCRSDLFSLGILLYEMVSGHNPFLRANAYDQLRAIQSAEARPLCSHRTEWAPLDAVIDRLLAKSPDERFADPASVAEALLDLRQQLPRPAQRLGAFVSATFGGELAELASAVTDSKIRVALAPTDPKLRAARAAPPAPKPELLDGATLMKAAPRPPPLEEQTLLKARVALASAVEGPEATAIIGPGFRPRSRSGSPWLALGLLSFAATSAAAWLALNPLP
jgi:eukaryotic-like serine/threonine-protein kinase